MQIARFVARLTIGGLFIGHGTQKLFGWFGGGGVDGTTKLMASLGMHPPREQALAAGITEAGAGAMIAAGLGTPLAASSLIGVMSTAIDKAHWSKGLWNYNGGYEYNLVLLTCLAAVAESGPGALSLDHAFGIERQGTRWAAGAVALGVAAAALNTQLSRRMADQHRRGPDDATSESHQASSGTPVS